MYRFYFKIKDEKGCIISIRDIIEKNSTIAYKVIKAKFKGLKPILATRKSVIF